MRVWYPKPFSDAVLAQLQALLPGHEVTREPSDDTQILIEGRPTEADLAKVPNLERVIIPFAGVPHATIELLRQHPHIDLHNLHHNAAQTAETALALLFAAAKRTVPIDALLRKNDWTPRYEPERTELLSGKTAVILGYGEIGKRIGACLTALGVNILPVRRHPQAGEFGPEHLHQVLPRAQILIITLPHTAETEGLIGPQEIANLPPNAILVNVARAQIVNEKALFDALKTGKLHSAGLDVWYRYPQSSGSAVPGYFQIPETAKNSPPANLPFHELDSVVMSPHRGGASAGTEELRVEHLAHLIHAAADGGPVPNKVNIDLGY